MSIEIRHRHLAAAVVVAAASTTAGLVAAQDTAFLCAAGFS